MPSDLIVQVTRITNIRKHPNADRLSCAKCGEWPVIVANGKYVDNDLVVFIPPDSVISDRQAVRECAEGPPTFGGNHVREGVVVRPVVERLDARGNRTVRKYLSDDYLLDKRAERADVTDR